MSIQYKSAVCVILGLKHSIQTQRTSRLIVNIRVKKRETERNRQWGHCKRSRRSKPVFSAGDGKLNWVPGQQAVISSVLLKPVLHHVQLGVVVPAGLQGESRKVVKTPGPICHSPPPCWLLLQSFHRSNRVRERSMTCPPSPHPQHSPHQ